jgi:hypothetical protein
MSASEKKAPAVNETRSDGPRDPEVIRTEIDGAREELGETVAAVAEKTDVKKQAEAKKDELKEQVSAKAEALKEAAPESAQEGMQQAQRLASENPVPVALAGAFLAGMVLGRLLSR